MPTTSVFSLRLPNARAESLRRVARRLNRSASEVAARFVDEGLRCAEFALIDFRDTPAGRSAYVKGSRLPVWRVVTLVEKYEGSLGKVAEHLTWPTEKVQAAMNYAAAFPQEIADELEDNRSYDFSKLSRLIPGLELAVVPASKER